MGGKIILSKTSKRIIEQDDEDIEIRLDNSPSQTSLKSNSKSNSTQSKPLSANESSKAGSAKISQNIDLATKQMAEVIKERMAL